ncbi:MAG: thioredoxin [Proteobacteria bacterium]|nr:MAG: thioredoxin [Pseudomonadota bacterium]
MEIGARQPAAAGQSDVIKDTTTANFAKDVLEASRSALVLVDFWAAWCGPCRQLTPILEKVVRSYNGKVRLVKLNVDEHPAIAGQLRVQSLPTVYAFRDGRPLDGFMGAQPESAVRAFIDRLLGEDSQADVEAFLEAAEQTLEAGDLQQAAQMYAAVLQEDRENVVALAGLAKCYLKSGDIARAEQTIALVPPDKRQASAVASVAAALELARKAGAAGDVADLQAKVEANPANLQARFDLALALAARDDKAGAVDQLLEIYRRDRNWNDEAARKQLIQLFDAWGPKDPHTIEGRRRLSSLMFA